MAEIKNIRRNFWKSQHEKKIFYPIYTTHKKAFTPLIHFALLSQLIFHRLHQYLLAYDCFFSRQRLKSHLQYNI